MSETLEVMARALFKSKLICGELRVRDAERFVKGVGRVDRADRTDGADCGRA